MQKKNQYAHKSNERRDYLDFFPNTVRYRYRTGVVKEYKYTKMSDSHFQKKKGPEHNKKRVIKGLKKT